MPCGGVQDGKDANSILYEGDMLFRSKQDFDALPPDEPPRCEGRYTRRFEVVCRGLKGMLAAYRGIDPGDRGVRHIDEEGCDTCQL